MARRIKEIISTRCGVITRTISVLTCSKPITARATSEQSVPVRGVCPCHRRTVPISLLERAEHEAVRFALNRIDHLVRLHVHLIVNPVPATKKPRRSEERRERKE